LATALRLRASTPVRRRRAAARRLRRQPQGKVRRRWRRW